MYFSWYRFKSLIFSFSRSVILHVAGNNAAIEKIINNNIVSAVDSKGREVVVMGRGLGFGMKPGRQIQENKIEKVFRIKSQTLAEQFKD